MSATMNQLTNSYKGARDFYPEDKRFQKWMFKTIRRVVEKFGYEEYDAPVLESTALYTLKGSEEIVSEQSYTFEDRGGRSVTMRTEMTPSVSRMVAARRQELAYPLRWYSIPNLWRYERPQKGRLREFWQLNVDIFGVAGIEADAEIIQVADAVLQAFKAKRSDYVIRINSRVFVDFVLTEFVGLSEVEASTMRRLIDRKAKMDRAEFVAQVEAVMNPAQRESGDPERLLQVLDAEDIAGLPEEVRESAALAPVRGLLGLLGKAGISNARFDPSLMRGFDYYTDIVFEVFDTDPDNNRSMFGGGRYDGLVGLFGVEPVATVGFGMGDATLENFIRGHGLAPKQATETDLYLVCMDGLYADIQELLTLLRREGVRVGVDTTNRKIGKCLETADKKGIRFAMVVGRDEIDSGQFRLKNLVDKTEETHGIERIISIVLSARATR